MRAGEARRHGAFYAHRLNGHDETLGQRFFVSLGRGVSTFAITSLIIVKLFTQ